MYPSAQETGLWVALNLAQRTLHQSMEAALKAQNLPTLRWYDVLWALERSDGGLRPFELERALLFEQSNLSRQNRRMIDEGLIEEQVCPQDRRGKILTITASGRRVRKRMWEVYGPLLHDLVSAVTADRDASETVALLMQLIPDRETVVAGLRQERPEDQET